MFPPMFPVGERIRHEVELKEHMSRASNHAPLFLRLKPVLHRLKLNFGRADAPRQPRTIRATQTAEIPGV